MKAKLFTILLSAIVTVSLAQTPNGLADSNNYFALKLYRHVNEGAGRNIFFSPFSISSAMAMTYVGAKDETAKQMAHAMHFNKDQSIFHPNFRNLLEKIGNDTADTSKAIKLDLANAIWIAGGLHFMPSFTEIVKKIYHAEARYVSFSNESVIENSRGLINGWVESKTHNKIKNLIKPGMLNTKTRIVLVNAIYFNARWMVPFNKEMTRKDTFHTATTGAVSADFMHIIHPYGYYANDMMQVVELPYYNNKLSMVLFLPAENIGMSNFEELLDYKHYKRIVDSIKPLQVALAMPKFRTTSEFELSDVLSKMGMAVAFTPMADFSGMTTEGLQIDKVLHKAYVDVDETGTEAAAATAVTMRPTAMRPPDKRVVVNVDRPFVFVIKDNETGCILFMGRICNPLVE